VFGLKETNQPTKSSGYPSQPPKASVDGVPSPPRSSNIEKVGVSPSVPSVTPVTPTKKLCPKSGTTNGCVLPIKPPQPLKFPVTPPTQQLLKLPHQLLLVKQILTPPTLWSSSPSGPMEMLKLLLLLQNGTPNNPSTSYGKPPFSPAPSKRS